MKSRSIYLSTQKSVAANVQLLLETLRAWGVIINTTAHSDHNECGKVHTSTINVKNEHHSHNVTIPYEITKEELCSHEQLANFTVNVFLHLHDLHRDTFLEHAHGLYNATVLMCVELHLDVIPVLKHTVQSLQEGGENLEEEEEAREKKEVKSENQSINEISEYAHEQTYISKEIMLQHVTFRPTYPVVALGGTFDRLHAGHKLLLTTAMLYATDKVLVGVSAEGLLARKKYAEVLQPFEIRKRNTEQFLRKLRKDCDVEVFAITDVAGGMDCNTEVTALVVSPETERSLDSINVARANNHLQPLHKILIPFITTPDGKLINSTLLRERAIAQRRQETKQTI